MIWGRWSSHRPPDGGSQNSTVAQTLDGTIYFTEPGTTYFDGYGEFVTELVVGDDVVTITVSQSI